MAASVRARKDRRAETGNTAGNAIVVMGVTELRLQGYPYRMRVLTVPEYQTTTNEHPTATPATSWLARSAIELRLRDRTAVVRKLRVGVVTPGSETVTVRCWRGNRPARS